MIKYIPTDNADYTAVYDDEAKVITISLDISEKKHLTAFSIPLVDTEAAYVEVIILNRG